MVAKLSPKVRITESVILQASNEVSRINDNQIIGFHVRLGKPQSDGGRLASYYYFYRIGGRNGRQVNYFIGNSSNIDAGLARRIAVQIQPHVKAEKDILKMKFEAEKSNVRLKDFWLYLGRDFFVKKYKNQADAIRNIEAIILPAIGSVHLDKLSHQLVELRVVRPMQKRNTLSQLKVVISQLRGLLKHAVQCHYLTVQPLASFDIEQEKTPITTKISATLSGAQIKGLYYRASKVGRNAVYLYTLRLQILTGLDLTTICASYRQDIRTNLWSLRASNGKLTGKIIPLSGPLKLLLKEILKTFPRAQSLYLFPAKKSSGKQQTMDVRSLAKAQQRFIFDVQQVTLSMSQLLSNIERAMIEAKLDPLVVAHLFNKKLADYLTLDVKDPKILTALETWYKA
ncbi:MAG: hypothetical protein HRU25_15810 [Psychrobium sp.]|nr:hypothetical protein [Psychrobium sp.]